MAGLIRQSDIEEVKARTNLADIIGDYVTLKSAGIGSLKGLCPFHDERTPSFHVRPQVGFYHCFGCGESGDVYSFLQKMDHVTFSEAVERLAARVGLELHYEGGTGAAPEHGNRARLLAANQAAADFFVEQLGSPGAEVGRAFLGSRGFDEAAATMFGIGFAPKSWDELTKHLRNRGFTTEELTLSGLVSSGDRGIYDRFRGRLVWPIRDITGQTIGFGARKLLDDDPGPKYLNTPETPVYHKSQVLYGLDLAKRDISRNQQVVIVEGYTDVMACHLAGVTTAVATCGTSFGVDHIKVLRRVLSDDSGAGEVIFTFDPDAAGQKAAMRAFAEEQRFSAQTYVAVPPEGLDPCDLRLHRGDDAVRRLVDSKKPMFEFMIRQLLSQYNLETVEGRAAALRSAAPLVSDIRDETLRPGYTRELARMLGIDMVEVSRAVAGAKAKAQAGNARADGYRDGSSGGAAGDYGRHSPGPGDAASVATMAVERPFALVELPGDPVTRLERDGLMAMLQLPVIVGVDIVGRAAQTSFTHTGLAVVRDAIAANLDHADQADWLERVLNDVPPQLANLVHELAMANLPERSEKEVHRYVKDITIALIDRDLLRQKAELLGRLQRADPEQREVYAVLQRELVRVEAERRGLRDE
ncbi:DNA primase [Cryobacterium melibiosiphilum]|uniref:DNA primase n=1 Tax=Cryobacterium melibiosiphilum TaxID=995039 RepID=A0A3A5MH01_9MICO|nr:DNA primase [Cryobacterium melibiosiphilum]RJT87219.1 DNA primase [Cryobacterium melibiosiphilum]